MDAVSSQLSTINDIPSAAHEMVAKRAPYVNLLRRDHRFQLATAEEDDCRVAGDARAVGDRTFGVLGRAGRHSRSVSIHPSLQTYSTGALDLAV
ncbi:hypothetical protein MTO96_048343 [Rhipicephalus appendiculatus]